MTEDAAFDRTIDRLTRRLLARRTPSGGWEGHLASSALATAVATIALTGDARASARDHDALIHAGLDWLAAHQNADGGWGDTTISPSNLSTTVLCRAALCLGGPEGPPLRKSNSIAEADLQSAVEADLQVRLQRHSVVDRAERWLRAEVGDLSAASLRGAILARYGTDRTFSAPILTVLALTGQLGADAQAWRLVPQLPFELAACPHRWFRWLQLPVVSYALPALVAIGQVRHHHAPTRNPLLRPVRSALRSRTLRIARRMQPESGGYLEAVPLTAFVVMSLVSAGAAHDPIVSNGVRFLIASARRDGSWPIDTNLATWVTTLSVQATARDDRLSAEERARTLQWLLAQQVAREHPFTHARPGGWAWTDLSGGVPDADDTAGALLAIRHLAGVEPLGPAMAGIRWLLELQNRDGGIPTFCRGWGALPFDRSAPDLTAHALDAWSAWYDAIPDGLKPRVSRAAERALSYLVRHQRADGSWVPLWFGSEHAAGELNPTYGTARVVASLSASLARLSPAAEHSQRRGIAWLLDAQNGDGGWGGAAAVPSSIEETGMALYGLSRCDPPSSAIADAVARGTRWLVLATDEGRQAPASPIGLYFARLWYYEELYPIVWGLRGLSEARELGRERPVW